MVIIYVFKILAKLILANLGTNIDVPIGEVPVLLFVVGAVFGEVQVSLFVVGAVFAEGQVLLFVAGAALGECLNVRLGSKRCILQ